MPRHLGLHGGGLAIARIALVVLPAFLLFGYNQSNIGGVLDLPAFTETFPQIDTTTTEGRDKVQNATIQGTVVAIYTIGCLIGSIASATIGDRFGRRLGLIIHTVTALIGQVLQASSYNLAQLVVGRIVTGLGIGGVNSLVPVWQSECAKPKNRGKNVVIVGVFVALGQAMAAWINFGLTPVSASQVAWRLPLAIPIVFDLMIILTTFIFPESPCWLVEKGRMQEAACAIAVLDDVAEDGPEVRAATAGLAHSETAHQHRRWKDLVSKDQRQKQFYRALLAFAVNFNGQMTGANAVTYYAKKIFRDSLGFASREAAVLSGGVLSWKILACFVPLFIVDRFGRKILFIIAGTGMCTAMVGLAGTVSHISSAAAGMAAVFFVFFYMGFFTVGYLGANFLYATELAPGQMRAHFSAIGTATHWCPLALRPSETDSTREHLGYSAPTLSKARSLTSIPLFNFVIAEIVPICFASVGWRTYIIFAVISAFSVVLVVLFFPETAGKSFEEIDDMFAAAPHWYSMVLKKDHRSMEWFEREIGVESRKGGEKRVEEKDDGDSALHVESR